eukprot:5357316-Amphidinium_carterae.1
MKQHHQWSIFECWKQAVKWCPEVFGNVHPDSYRRWHAIGQGDPCTSTWPKTTSRATASKATFPADKLGCTVTVVVPASGDMQPLTQVSVKGNTTRPRPTSPLPPRPSITHTDTHGASQNSAMELLALVQERIGPNTRWILLWDCAPVAGPLWE